MKLAINRRVRAGIFAVGVISIDVPLIKKPVKTQVVGIIHDIDHEAGTAILHALDGAGETQHVVAVELGQLTQARLDEIPKSRRPNKAQASRLGYL
jgi:hypothetical protein